MDSSNTESAQETELRDLSLKKSTLEEYAFDVKRLKELTILANDSCSLKLVNLPDFQSAKEAKFYMLNTTRALETLHQKLNFHSVLVEDQIKRTAHLEKAMEAEELREFAIQLQYDTKNLGAREALREANYTATRIQTGLVQLEGKIREILEPLENHGPELDIPVFNGNIQEWSKFWHQFEFAIHSRNLSKEVKYCHLINKLKGEAAYITDQLDISAVSYDFAIAKLHELYGSKVHVFKSISNEIARLPRASLTYASINENLLKIEMLLRRLKFNLADENSVLLTSLLSPKFPVEFSKEVFRIGIVRGEEKIDFEHWLQYATSALKILKEEEDIDNCAINLASVGSELKTNSYFSSNNEPLLPQNSSNTSVQLEKQQDKFKSLRTKHPKCKTFTSTDNCPFCKKDHCPEDCHLEYKARTKLMMKNGQCWACFKTDHPSHKCKYGCYYCGKKHHPSLCKTLERHVDVESSKFSSTGLMIGVAQLYKQKSTVSFLLDTGSDYSFILKDKVKELDLPTIGSRELCISTFGNIQSESKYYTIARVNLIDISGKKVELDAFIIDSIAHNVKVAQPSQLDRAFMNKRKLELITTNNTSSTPDLLIGIDQFFTILGEGMQKIRLPSGFHYVSTRLGGLITGSTKNLSRELNSSQVPDRVSFTNHSI